MTASLAFVFVFCLGAAPSLSGTVLDAAGQPIAGARVFAESGLAGPLVETQSAANGTFHFEDLPSGETGVFAIAPGHAWGGFSLSLAPGESIVNRRITLHPPAQLRGRIVNPKGDAIAEARITRIALLGADKVGIPYSKLKSLGFPEPMSGPEGDFILTDLPRGGSVALKAGHTAYAQTALSELQVGDTDAKITLYPGVLLQGEVVSRGRKLRIANAAVIVRNAQPPHDTAVVTSDSNGIFSIRLNPGTYLYQAASLNARSAGWQKLELRGDAPPPRMQVIVGGMGAIRGELRDAATGAPIEGARIRLEADGLPAASLRTGSNGAFRFTVSEGQNTVRLENAPGYQPPETAAFTVTVAEGQEVELPGLWLAPIPRFRVQVLDESGAPVPGVALSLLEPEQLGWQISGEDGWAVLDVAVLPEGGRIIGRAEHPARPLGAVFQLAPADASGARVQLFPLGRVTGLVTNTRKKPLPGARVGGVFPGMNADDPVLLWRSLAGPDGRFSSDAVVPGVPQRCLAQTGLSLQSESATFNLAPAENKELDPISIEGGTPGESLLGQPLDWSGYPVLCGAEKIASVRNAPSVLLLFVAPQAAAAAIEAAAKLDALLASRAPAVLIAVNGLYACGDAPLPVLRAAPPATATTYLLDAAGKVLLETFGLPPLRAFQ